MKRRTTWIALLAALVVAVAAFWLWRGRAVPVDVVEVRSAPLVRTLQFWPAWRPPRASTWAAPRLAA